MYRKTPHSAARKIARNVRFVFAWRFFAHTTTCTHAATAGRVFRYSKKEIGRY